MMKVAMALVSTAVGLALLLSFKTQSAGTPRSALAGSGPGSRSVTGSSGGAGSDDGTGSDDGAGSDDGTGSHVGTGTGTKSATRPKASAPAGGNGTFAGDPIGTPYGTMQVAAVIRNGKLTDINVLRETDGGRSHQIDAAAIPILRSEALSAHGANIDVVSGATFTSQGYARSLQSALDRAGI